MLKGTRPVRRKAASIFLIVFESDQEHRAGHGAGHPRRSPCASSAAGVWRVWAGSCMRRGGLSLHDMLQTGAAAPPVLSARAAGFPFDSMLEFLFSREEGAELFFLHLCQNNECVVFLSL